MLLNLQLNYDHKKAASTIKNKYIIANNNKKIEDINQTPLYAWFNAAAQLASCSH